MAYSIKHSVKRPLKWNTEHSYISFRWLRRKLQGECGSPSAGSY